MTQKFLASLVVAAALLFAAVLGGVQRSGQGNGAALPASPASVHVNPNVPSDLVEVIERAAPKATESEELVQPDEAVQAGGEADRNQDPEVSPAETWIFEDGDERGFLIRPGVIQVVDSSGRVVAEGGWLDGKKDGFWQYFADDGSTELEGRYVAGLADGPWTQYSQDGSVSSQANTRNGKYHGPCYFYVPRKHAPELVSGIYEDGELVEAF